MLTRTHLRELGLERRAVDAVFRELPIVEFPGYSRPLIRADDYRALVDEHTYNADRVRPVGNSFPRPPTSAGTQRRGTQRGGTPGKARS